MATKTRYTITSVRVMISTLDDWIDQTTDSIDTEESKDYPSDDRLDTLNNRLDQLVAAKDALDDIE